MSKQRLSFFFLQLYLKVFRNEWPGKSDDSATTFYFCGPHFLNNPRYFKSQSNKFSVLDEWHSFQNTYVLSDTGQIERVVNGFDGIGFDGIVQGQDYTARPEQALGSWIR